MGRQYMTLGYYSGFDDFFKAKLEVMDFEQNHVWGDTKLIRSLVKEQKLDDENDLENLAQLLKDEGLLNFTGHLVKGQTLDLALRHFKSIELPLREDEKRFATAWGTIHKLPATRGGKLKRQVKLPIGTYDEGTNIQQILLDLKPAFPLFDIDMALEEGVNKMLLVRREDNLSATQDPADTVSPAQE
ncbi:hypothetical protein [Marinospirillum sp.]|uniref:hypothetical protein n=1 Tax=Marinospirillum sp. TaxID=2183934 RepID=UPI00286FC88E|nr:hypothetical protein [Marinospirillum sp.]MDR9468679.1 hypothetical protein [Marinospirillum sp.]